MLVRERFVIRGSLGAGSLPPWIARHAARLGITCEISRADAAQVDLDIHGPVDLIDAMEMGCWLGPIDIWVETIDRVAPPSA